MQGSRQRRGSRPRNAGSVSALTPADLPGVLAASGAAVLKWDAGTDVISWSAEAGEALLIGSGLPASGAELALRCTDATSDVRASTIRKAAAIGGGVIHYACEYAFAPARAVERPRWMEERGTLTVDAGGGVMATASVLREARLSGSAPEGESGGRGLDAALPRAAFLAIVDNVLREHVKTGAGSSAVIVIGLDDLPGINANFGYDVADAVIDAIAMRVHDKMRGGDVLGRTSSNRLAALLNDCGEADIAVAAERLLAAVSDEDITAGGAVVAATVSIGASLIPRHASNAAQGLFRAEEALEASKTTDHAAFRLYQPSPDGDRARRRSVQLSQDIVKGLADDRFILAYQPIVDARTGALLHHEALARLVQEDGLVVSAGPIIATAERIGLVRRIDRRVLKLVLADLKRRPDLRLAVNLSARSLADEVWRDMLLAAVAEDASIPRRLSVEVTETTAAGNIDELVRFAAFLREVGCEIAIDDFGTGHTSFLALSEVAVDWVKIDGSFFCNLADKPGNLVFVETLVRLARHFGIRTVAEWVMDEGVAKTLAEIGVDALQGRLIGDAELQLHPEVSDRLPSNLRYGDEA
jgi:diguanylate cyclase (GGDEF)-like protein